MFDVGALLWAIPGLPLLAAGVTACLGPNLLKRQSHWPVILGSAGSCAVSVILLFALATSPGQKPALEAPGLSDWFSIGDFQLPLTLQADSLSAVMLLAITFVGTMIAIFSSYYMAHEDGYPRYFAVMGLFLAAMTGLVLASNFLVLYAFWEGVGLCSYLLVGFWFQKPAAAAAARKAFLVTRIGDAGFILGIMILWQRYGSFDYSVVFQRASANPHGLELPCLLLFCGAIGKSAQFPLHVWLPDAMEGPTPASALIHAATMVTAGVYLLARCAHLFALTPTTQLVVSCVGGFTALLAALIALTQHDLKRVLAYSTVSQLGFMFLGLGAGLRDNGLAVFAASAAIFHLFTHAFFKALLFMTAGSIMNSMGHVIDMRRFGGLRRVLPVTHWTFLCGALALAGLAPFAGFWSKDQILEAVLHAGHQSEAYGTIYMGLFAVALFTAGLTAFYTFRAYFRTFWGAERIPEEAYHHGHGHDTEDHGSSKHRFETTLAQKFPLVVLAIGAVVIGAILGAPHWINALLARSTAFVFAKSSPEFHVNWWLVIGSTVCASAGIGLAAWMYLIKPALADKLAAAAPSLHRASTQRFYFDELYTFAVVKPLAVFALVMRFFDSIVDGIVDLVGMFPRWFARFLRTVQDGLVQSYTLIMLVFLTAFLAIFVLWTR
jgi:NADH-quinone oxidoreductase subunit L